MNDSISHPLPRGALNKEPNRLSDKDAPARDIVLKLTQEESAELEYFLRREGNKSLDAKYQGGTYLLRQLCRKLANRLNEALLLCLHK